MPAAPRAPHLDAIVLYERGIRALQGHEPQRALELFQSVIDQFPDEKELHERARLYMNIARRQMTPPDPTPRSLDERLYAVTLDLNAGAYGDALKKLTALDAEAPDNDHVQYMLAVVHAQRREVDEACRRLKRAIALNAENRALALQDVDLDSIRHEPVFRDATGRAAPRDRRPRGRTR